MGSSKFRISDMMPNSWFYKLKNMGKGRTTGPKRQTKSTAPIEPSNSKLTKQPPPPRQPSHRNLSAPQARKSYHFSRQEGICAANSPRLSQSNYPDPPRKSTRRKSTGRSRRMSLLSSGRRVPSHASSCAAGCSCSDRHTATCAKPDLTTPEYSISTSPFDSSPETKIGGRPLLPEFRSDAILPTESSVSWSSTCSCGTSANSAPNDIEMDAKSFNSNNKFDVISELDLAPIVTKKAGDFKNRSPGTGRTLAGHYSPGMRLRLNSPKIASRRIQALSGARRSVSSLSTTCSARPRRRRSVSDSFAVVKVSKDPKNDFRESMVEMIMQNNIWDSKDLEELLACYLSLNSDEYHGVIISVFKQIWHDLTVTDDARVK